MASPLGSEKISEMPSAGTLTGSELVPIVRLGARNLNLTTTPVAIAAFGGGGTSVPWTLLGSATTYAVPDGSVDGQQAVIFDNNFNGNTTLNGTFTFGSTILMRQQGQALWIRWNGATWDVPTWIGVLGG